MALPVCPPLAGRRLRGVSRSPSCCGLGFDEKPRGNQRRNSADSIWHGSPMPLVLDRRNVALGRLLSPCPSFCGRPGWDGGCNAEENAALVTYSRQSHNGHVRTAFDEPTCILSKRPLLLVAVAVPRRVDSAQLFALWPSRRANSRWHTRASPLPLQG